MKVLFVGQLGYGQTSRMRLEALQMLGHDVTGLNIAPFSPISSFQRQLLRITNRGAAVSALNAAIVERASVLRPDLLWAEKVEYLEPETVITLRRAGTRFLHYTPDPYFSLSWKRTRLLDACMPLFDYACTSKSYELADYRRVCREVFYMPLGYWQAVHRPVVPRDVGLRRTVQADVSFLGGWEPRREDLLDAVARVGCRLNVWGYAWDHVIDGRWTPRRYARMRLLAGKDRFTIRRNRLLSSALRGGEVYGDDYAFALSGARIGVGFLRHVCPDQHTTRTFEIPACGSMLLADRTEEHRSFFEEGSEAEFFSSRAELVDKARFYIRNEAVCERIAQAGYSRCVNSGYSYQSRVKTVMNDIE